MRNFLDDTLFFLQVGQILIAIVLSICLVAIKPTRENGIWFIVPLILIAFAPLYSFVLHLVYPCC